MKPSKKKTRFNFLTLSCANIDTPLLFQPTKDIIDWESHRGGPASTEVEPLTGLFIN